MGWPDGGGWHDGGADARLLEEQARAKTRETEMRLEREAGRPHVPRERRPSRLRRAWDALTGRAAP
jgi:hypothetical protein